jgi:hypothetical protein
MNFVEDDQAILVLPQEESWLCEFVSILPSFKVEVERPWTLVCDLSCQSCFTYLARPDDSDSGLLSEGMLNEWSDGPGNHPCIIKHPLSICMVPAGSGASVLKCRELRCFAAGIG